MDSRAAGRRGSVALILLALLFGLVASFSAYRVMDSSRPDPAVREQLEAGYAALERGERSLTGHETAAALRTVEQQVLDQRALLEQLAQMVYLLSGALLLVAMVPLVTPATRPSNRDDDPQ